jgi:GTP:adenosylcobinamide-phosphate guanylyltransferase
MIAVSCARMNSTRFPGKNLFKLNGKPLIQYTIDLAGEIKVPLYIFTRDIEIMEYVGDQCPIIYEPEYLYDTPHNSTIEKMRYASMVIGSKLIMLLQPNIIGRDPDKIKEWIGDFQCLDVFQAETVHDGESNGNLFLYNFNFKPGTGGYFNDDSDIIDIDYPENAERAEKWLKRF